jgi:hypothetical protein
MPFLAPFVPALIGAAAGVGTAAIAAGSQKHAANAANAAQQAAADKALAAQQANLDRIAGLEAALRRCGGYGAPGRYSAPLWADRTPDVPERRSCGSWGRLRPLPGALLVARNANGTT